MYDIPVMEQAYSRLTLRQEPSKNQALTSFSLLYIYYMRFYCRESFLDRKVGEFLLVDTELV